MPPNDQRGPHHALCAALLALLLGGCSHAVKVAEPAPLTLQQHPLAEKIWDVRGQRFVTAAEVQAAARASDYVLLGETHDNIAHHRHHAAVITALTGVARPVAVAFEMIDREQGARIAGQRFATSADLIEALGSDGAAWEYRRYYAPVFDSALTAGFGIFPANIGRRQLMALVGGGEPALPDDLRQRLAATPLPAAQDEALRQEIIVGHCNMLPESVVPKLMLGQRIRDAAMSLDLAAARGDGLAVLVAGSGHVRSDRGVPFYLRRHEPAARILSVGWLEVAEGKTDPADYRDHWGGGEWVFDYVWFTARAERPDPCEQMRRHAPPPKPAE